MVRPVVTYLMVAFYLIYKWALFQQASLIASDWSKAATMIWTEADLGILYLVLGFYFGSRMVKAAFGGSAQTGKAGGG